MRQRGGRRGYGFPVNRADDFVRDRWVECVAVLLAGAGVIEGLLAEESADRGPAWFLPFVVPLMALPLLFAGRFPFAAPVTTVLVGVAIGAAAGGATVTDSVIAFFLLFLVAWLFGRLDRRSAVAGLLLLFAAVVVVDIEADELAFGNVIFPMVFLTLFWGASVFVRNREERALEAEERARLLALAHESAAERAVEEERQRIARELHDVIAHSVSVMTVQAGAVRRLLLPEQERERQALQTVESTGREALTEMRRLVGLLRDEGAMPEFAPQPSLKTLDILIGTVREAGLDVDLDVQGKERELPPGVDLSAYRLVQEALTNTLKYAGPARAWVTLRWREDELEVEVANDGLDDASTSGGSGHGLAGMRERVALCGGTLETGTRDGGGFVVRCHLPLEAAA
jgi:signal transduction histidine kinase